MYNEYIDNTKGETMIDGQIRYEAACKLADTLTEHQMDLLMTAQGLDADMFAMHIDDCNFTEQARKSVVRLHGLRSCWGCDPIGSGSFQINGIWFATRKKALSYALMGLIDDE